MLPIYAFWAHFFDKPYVGIPLAGQNQDEYITTQLDVYGNVNLNNPADLGGYACLAIPRPSKTLFFY